jgi:hypothetical protein
MEKAFFASRSAANKSAAADVRQPDFQWISQAQVGGPVSQVIPLVLTACLSFD